MEIIQNTADLKAAIAKLKIQQATDLFFLKEEFVTTKEKFKLSNIIKSGFKQVTSSPNITTDLLNTAVGLTTGIVTKKILIGKTINPLKNLLGKMLEVFVASKVVSNADTLKAVASVLRKKIMPGKEDKVASV